MSGLLVLGAGGHGRVIADAASHSYQTIAFLDDSPDSCECGRWPVLGPIKDLSSYRNDFTQVTVAVGDNARRLLLIERLIGDGVRIVSIVHPSATVSPNASIGSGSVILAQSAVNIGSRLGLGCIVNTGATIDHDCELGDGVHVSPGAHLAGNVSVGARAWIGIGAAVREGVKIGADVVVGAGAAVIDNVAVCTTVVGVPAKTT